jgi:hypothetical protein
MILCILFLMECRGGSKGGGRTRRAPPKFSRLPPQLEKIWFFDVKSWFFTWNTPNIFAPPSARRNFFKCAPPPLTWNPGYAPGMYLSLTKLNFRCAFMFSNPFLRGHLFCVTYQKGLVQYFVKSKWQVWICFNFICMLLLCLCLFDLCTYNLYIFLVKL